MHEKGQNSVVIREISIPRATRYIAHRHEMYYSHAVARDFTTALSSFYLFAVFACVHPELPLRAYLEKFRDNIALHQSLLTINVIYMHGYLDDHRLVRLIKNEYEF